MNEPSWIPEAIWRGETVFILGGGPTLTPETVEKLRGRNVIVVNSAALIAPWADFLFFTDNSWLEPRIDLVAVWAGVVVTSSRHAARSMPNKIRRIQGEMRDETFPAVGSPTVRHGRSSGHTAIGLAVALGAATIVLLGYDMRVVNGREHHHEEYAGPRDLNVYETEFLPGFAGWNAGAIKAGVRVLNATPGSALREFPMIDFEEALTL